MKNGKNLNKDKIKYAIVFALLALIVILLCIPDTRLYLVGFFGYAVYAYVVAVAAATVLMLSGRRVVVDKKHIALYLALFFAFMITLHIGLAYSLVDGGWKAYIVGPFSTTGTVGGMLVSICTCFLVIPMGYLASLIVFLLITAALGLLALWPLLIKRAASDAERKPLFEKRTKKSSSPTSEVVDDKPKGIYLEDLTTTMPYTPEPSERLSPDYKPESPASAASRILFENEQPASKPATADGDVVPQTMRQEFSEMERSFLTRSRGSNGYSNGLNVEDPESDYQRRYGNIPVYTGQEDVSDDDVSPTIQDFAEQNNTEDSVEDSAFNEDMMYGDINSSQSDDADSRSDFEPETDDLSEAFDDDDDILETTGSDTASVVSKPYIVVEEQAKPPKFIADNIEKKFVEQTLQSTTTVAETRVRKPESKPEPMSEISKKVKRPYQFPPLELLPKGEYSDPTDIDDYGANKSIIDLTLSSFGIGAHVVGAIKGPAVTRYELSLDEGVLVKRIENIVDNLAMRLKVSSVRILAPIKGKDAVGIEIPNKIRSSVMLRDLINSQEFNTKKGGLIMALGKTVDSLNFVYDLSAAPHMLVAGQTGSGKSVCINTILISLLYKYSPDELKIILVDPKQVELATYCNLPHMLIPQTLDSVPQTINALKWLGEEMDRRYKFLKRFGANNIDLYNNNIRKPDEQKIPRIVFVMDEMADFMARSKAQIESAVVPLASMGRAAGIHLILATQRPSADVITSLIKSNIPTTIAFSVRTITDSQVILGPGEPDAKTLLGKGDMLFKTQSLSDNVRLQCAYIDMPDVVKVTSFIRSNNDCEYDNDADAFINPPPAPPEEEVLEQKEQAQEMDYERLCIKVLKTFIMRKKASVSLIQQVHGVGFNKASRIFQTISEWGVISEFDGSQKPRRVLIDMDEFNQRFAPKLEDGTDAD